MTVLDYCKLKVSIENYVLAFMTLKLMHRSMKHHLRFTGGVSHQSLVLTIMKTSIDYYYKKFMAVVPHYYNIYRT